VLENNTHLIYPALALFALVAIIVGILQAYRADDLSLVDKAEIKREIIQELRKHLSGLTVESLARSVALPRRKVDQVLEEMRTENIVDASTDGQRNTTWRMKL
jgi:hypothetical protein